MGTMGRDSSVDPKDLAIELALPGMSCLSGMAGSFSPGKRVRRYMDEHLNKDALCPQGHWMG